MKSNTFEIRCILAAAVVLAGAGLAVRRVAADAPAGRYTYPRAGTVYDTKTKLTWQQAASAPTYTWSDAPAYCTGNAGALPGTGWRLPSINELLTIVDDDGGGPAAIDPNAFPSTPTNTSFWTSSAAARFTNQAWCVNFSDGHSTIVYEADANSIRCVR